MKGTEKQIAWAKDIKDAAYMALDNMENNYKRFETVEKNLGLQTLGFTAEDVKAVREVVTAQMEGIEDAAVIINFRNNLTQKNFEQMAEMHHNRG